MRLFSDILIIGRVHVAQILLLMLQAHLLEDCICTPNYNLKIYSDIDYFYSLWKVNGEEIKFISLIHYFTNSGFSSTLVTVKRIAINIIPQPIIP